MEEKINNKLAEIKITIKEITKHFHYTEEEINILTISYLSMIMLDDEIEDLLMEVLSTTYILFTNEPVEKIYQRLLRKPLEESFLFKLLNDNSTYFGYMIKDNKLEHEHLIIISPADEIYQIFDNVTHELKHAINEIFPEFCLSQEPFFYSGLARGTSTSIDYNAIDEAFNSYLVKIYLDNINFLKRFYIQDPQISKLVKAFKLPKNYRYAYEIITIPCLPLFESEYLFTRLYYSYLYNSFYELDQALYNVFGTTKDSIDFFLYLDEILQREERIKEIENLDYSYLRKRVKITPYLK